MTHPKDLTREDAIEATNAVRLALGGLFHIAMAGALQSRISDEGCKALVLRLCEANEAALANVRQLEVTATSLPPRVATDG